MSFEAVTWALEAPVGGTQKVVLIGIASHADRYGDNSWPSMETLAVYAYCDIRTVQRAIRDLVAAGLLFRSINEGGTRKTAAHMRPNLYRLNMAMTWPKNALNSEALNGENYPPAPVSPPGTSVTPPPDTSVTPPPAPVSPHPPAPVSPEPSIEPSIEPSMNTSARKRAQPAQALQCPSDVDQQVFVDWIAVRKAKRAGPVTETVMAAMRAEAAAAGLSLNDALSHCCLSGWQGFKAAWFRRQTEGGEGQGGRSWRPHKSARQAMIEGGAAAIFDGATHV